MEKVQSLEWSKAQEITFGIDLVEGAKQQLRFLEAVDRVGCLYDGSALERAIYRYKNCWLPLLAKNIKSSILEGPLVVPLDCEWIWHCHRLNPVQYKRDCEEVYGRVLCKLNVLSTTEGAYSEKTVSLWNRIYVTEPYNLYLNSKSPNKVGELNEKPQKDFEYDLVAGVKRQSSFFRKVSKMMNYDDRFFEEAVAKYKGFLYLIKTIKERKLESFCVPTHDIDLIWHTHQLYPIAYSKDMKAIHGRVVNHNDRDSEPQKMKFYFARTKGLWEDLFGRMYCVGRAVPKNMFVSLPIDQVQAVCAYICVDGATDGGASACCDNCVDG